MSKRHEMLLFRYSSALEQGDFERIAAVLREAEHDATLEAMIVEMNEAYAAEQTERFNHTNHKEIPMLAPLYQNRTRMNTRFQSLLLIAAISLVAVMGIIITTQMRGNNVFNTGQPNTAGMVAQNEPLCEATTRTSVNVLSLPSTTNGVVVGTIPAGVTVRVLDQSYFIDDGGSAQLLWYFIAAEAVQGWASPTRLDRSECPANSVVLATPTPFDERLMMSATAIVAQASSLPPDVQGLATFTPEPFNPPDTTTFPNTNVPILIEPSALPPTVVPPVIAAQASVGTPDFPVYIVEEGDTLLSILTTFGFDASAMRDMTIINQLPEDAVLTPGQAILIPLNMPDLVTTCTVVPEQTLAVWLEPSNGANTNITTLPAGTSFEITGETEAPDGMWLAISAQVGSVTISGAWVRLAEMDFVTDCRTDFVQTSEAAAVEVLATFTPQPTPTIDPLAVAANTLDGSGCTVVTQNVVNIQDEPSNSAPVREQLPTGTPIAILAISRQADGAWYLVNYRSRMGGWMWGLISTHMLDVPEDCNYWGSSVIPEATLMMITATPVPAGTFTEYSNCTGVTASVTNVTSSPSMGAQVREQLPEGMEVEVMGAREQSDGMWYRVRYQNFMRNYTGGFVAPDTLVLSDECVIIPMEGVIVTTAPVPLMTATIAPTLTPTPAA